MFADIPLFPEQASTVAGRVDAVFFYILGITVVFSTGIAACLIYFAVRYRRRPGDEVPQPVVGSLKLEALWIIVPFILTMIMFVWATSVYFAVAEVPPDALPVYVLGRQWMWKLQHLDGQREIN